LKFIINGPSSFAQVYELSDHKSAMDVANNFMKGKRKKRHLQ